MNHKTLPEILDNYLWVPGLGQEELFKSMHENLIKVIAKELMGCLPEKKVGLPSRDGWSMQQVHAYNQALDEVRARLTAFIGKEKK